MASKFKCCKTREHKDWFCLVCNNFFHPSCLKRTNNTYVIISDSLIYCSRQCSEMVADSDHDNVADDLRKIIVELKAELEVKTKHINRLKRASVTFAEEAAVSESQLLDDIENQNLKIKQLKKRVDDLTANSTRSVSEFRSVAVQTRTVMSFDAQNQTEDIGSVIGEKTFCDTTNAESQTDLLFCESGVSPEQSLSADLPDENGKGNYSDMDKLRNEISELSALNRNMLTSIEALSAENDLYAIQVKKLQGEIFQYVQDGVNRYSGVPNDKANSTSNKYSGAPNDKANSIGPYPKASKLQSQSLGIAQATKRKVLIYGDGSSRNYAINLKKTLDYKMYHVEGIVKSGAPLREISQNIFKVLTSFGHKDYVIVMLDINEMTSFKCNDLSNLLAVGKFTNVIFCYKYDYDIGRNIFYDFDRNVTHFIEHNINVSVSVIKNCRFNGMYEYNYSSLCQLFSSYICKFSPELNIVIKSIPLNVSNHLVSECNGVVSVTLPEDGAGCGCDWNDGFLETDLIVQQSP